MQRCTYTRGGSLILVFVVTQVRLPAGVADGMTLRIRGQGDVGLDESQDPGDL